MNPVEHRRFDHRKYRPGPVLVPAQPAVAEPIDRAGPDLGQRGSARRQSGPAGAHGGGPEASALGAPGAPGRQGDRGRLPGGEPAGLRLRALVDRGAPDPGGRDGPGPGPGPAGPDPPDLRVARRGAAGHRPCLQLHQPGAAGLGVRQRPGRGQGDRRAGRPLGPGGGGALSGHTLDLPVFAGELHRHRAGLCGGGLQRGDRRVAADPGAPLHRQSPGDGGVGQPECLRRSGRVFLHPCRPARFDDPVRPHPQRPGRRRGGGGAGPARGGRSRGRHPARQRRAHRQHGHRDAWP